MQAKTSLEAERSQARTQVEFQHISTKMWHLYDIQVSTSATSKNIQKILSRARSPSSSPWNHHQGAAAWAMEWRRFDAVPTLDVIMAMVMAGHFPEMA